MTRLSMVNLHTFFGDINSDLEQTPKIAPKNIQNQDP